jgi:hypothetical protein
MLLDGKMYREKRPFCFICRISAHHSKVVVLSTDDPSDEVKMHHSDLSGPPPPTQVGGSVSMLKPPSLQYTPPGDQYEQSPNGVLGYEHTMTSSAPLPLSMVNR